MSHPIIEGPVQVLKVVTPGAYWIRCDECNNSSRVPSSIKHKPVSGDYYYPLQGEKVFARDEDGFFYRGIVCGRRRPLTSTHRSPEDVPACWKYVVQLTDTFQVKDFDQDDVYPSYGKTSSSCGSAHLVSLLNVLPQIPPSSYGRCLEVDPIKTKAFEKSLVDWDQSVLSMTHLVGRHVSFAQSKTIKGSIYGTISISPPLVAQNGELCNDLSDYLNFEKLAVPLSFRFEQVVQALMNNPLTDRSELLVAFDPYSEVVVRKNPEPPPNKNPETTERDLNGFQVHPDDEALHQSLTDDYYINILYEDLPPEYDTVVRYVSPDGDVVLGTVLNLNVCQATQVCSSSTIADSCFYKSGTERTRTHYPEKMFGKPPFEHKKPRHPLLSYDFEEARKELQVAGGIFRELFLPYPFSLAVEMLMLQQLDSLGVEYLRDWQKLCLPTFCCRKNLLVIGSKSTSKLTTATVSALSWMNYVIDSKPDSVHPQLVMFFCDFERADKTVTFCKQVTDFRVIVSTSFFISEKQKQKAKHGCDILITTPANWIKLVYENVFDYSRLNNVIFDEFDRLYQMYTEEVANIFEVLGSSSGTRIQTVVLANNVREFINDDRIQRNVDFPTKCIVGAIRACCYLRLTPVVVFVQNNSGMRQLQNLVFRTRAQKCLLFCEDEPEGLLIIDKFTKNERVQFLHENLDEETAMKIVEDWDKSFSSGLDKLLICTDGCFKKLGCLKDVACFDVMISWMTSSYDILSSRFIAFRRDIAKLRNLSKASAYVLCDPDEIEELLLIKDILCDASFVNGALDELLSKASVQAEREKLSNICPAVLMFGKCYDFPSCTFRHVFLPGDNPVVLNARQFLNVDVLKIHNAFRYSVRVREVVSNNYPEFSKMTYGLTSNLNEIQNELLKSPKKPCPSTLKVGQMVGACIDTEGISLLRRATVTSILENGSCKLFTLSVMDFEEPDVTLPISQLFILPDKVLNYPEDIVDLYITGLMPADFKSDWQNDTHSYVSTLLNEIIKESNFLAGRVQIVCTKRSVLVDSLYGFRGSGPSQKTMVSITGSEFSSLKELILEGGYCVKNDAHLALLFELLNSAPGRSVTSQLCLPLNPEGSYGCRPDLPTHPAPAVVSSFDDPGLFYVQLEDDLDELGNFEGELSTSLDRYKQKLPLVAINELCAILYNGAWSRAMIFDIIGDLDTSVESIHVIFVDYGDTFLDAQPQNLYCLPENLTKVPFFAIQCELAGVKPTVSGEWHEVAIEEFRTQVRTSQDKMESLTVLFQGAKNAEQSSNCYWKYSVILAKRHDPELIVNTLLGRKGLANFDKTFKLPALSRIPSIEKPVFNGVAGINSYPF